ncbi:MLO-like protein [Senna tora]|uniref:MLO-like protein n=1 Tax=Senna tora TaxID=362788 RepID=A0A835C7J9_9FABA|nr:MLO-like protein [Senna tora]
MFIECEIQLYVKEKMVIDYGSHVLHNELAQILNGMVTVGAWDLKVMKSLTFKNASTDLWKMTSRLS